MKGDATSRMPLSFEDTEIAFERLNSDELKAAHRLFRLMGNASLVNLTSPLGTIAVRWNLPWARSMVRKTIYKQFCGGETLETCTPTIEALNKMNVKCFLDFGVEAKLSEVEIEPVKEQLLRTIDYASVTEGVPVICVKLTALAPDGLLEKMNTGAQLDSAEERLKERFLARVDEICCKSSEKGVQVFIDAEESWIQDAMDKVVNLMMSRYNKETVTVYQTYQMYRHDRLEVLKSDHVKAVDQGYLLGAKYVRGAYMQKERARAAEEERPSPIHADKVATDADFNAALRYCLQNHDTIASCCASHNMESNLLLAKLMEEQNVPKDHPHIYFCQLQGMSDYISFNLAKAGFNAAKYVVFGPVKEVVPYLVRRARENSSISGEMGRELKYITMEMKRRKT